MVPMLFEALFIIALCGTGVGRVSRAARALDAYADETAGERGPRPAGTRVGVVVQPPARLERSDSDGGGR